ncbi:LysR family transcriptional regulator [Burkholderia sp. Ax-1719]|jgi:DNA-binding transcriptional LysR family regulator|uniref:LysR family transcriptional regulator n=1 Tax=Burkholderia sp. Ax-1719 TaxID=2608334 RepID=UPI001422FF72|nr:LysR family transcriptional regulator [Burkholderia sp. Ax-1719]NIE62634.1 LysR family transcriptional regulator [Burkholderia sp. Ax-1719]
MDKWAQIEFFVQVAELGSLSKAAERLGMSSAAASRCLNALEERLSARLIERTTRRLWLTDAGHEYHKRCTAIMAELSEADAAVSEATVNPTGTLRVTASVSFASIYIAPALREFHQRYPDVNVQIVAANRYPDFIEAGIDVAIRTREHEADSGITVRKLAETRRVLAATPAYLARRGTPMTPDALAGHDMLVYNLANDPYVLHFQRGAKSQSVAIKSVLDANEGQVIRAAALADLGILIQPLYIIHGDIVAGKLVPILTDWKLPALTINIAYQSRRHQPAKIRVFTEFLIKRFEQLGLARRWNEIA